MRTREESRNSMRALQDFRECNPNIADYNHVIRFDALVLWKIRGQKLYEEDHVIVHWDNNGFNPGEVFIDAQREESHAEHFHGSFKPDYQFYTYDVQNNVLRIRDDLPFYEVVISTHSAQPQNAFKPGK